MNHVDNASLANYYLASKQLEKDNAELIAELRSVLRDILANPRWGSIGSINNVARLQVSRDLYERATKLAWNEE